MDTREAKRNVLIVEDNEITLLSLSTLFRRGGYEVYAAESVEQAKQMIDSVDSLFAVVTDFEFKTGTGLGILMQAREKFPKAKLSIFTAHDNLENRPDVTEFLMKKNMRGKIKFLYKPIESGAFADWLNE